MVKHRRGKNKNKIIEFPFKVAIPKICF